MVVFPQILKSITELRVDIQAIKDRPSVAASLFCRRLRLPLLEFHFVKEKRTKEKRIGLLRSQTRAAPPPLNKVVVE